jgi:hypothetical protein
MLYKIKEYCEFFFIYRKVNFFFKEIQSMMYDIFKREMIRVLFDVTVKIIIKFKIQ